VSIGIYQNHRKMKMKKTKNKVFRSFREVMRHYFPKEWKKREDCKLKEDSWKKY